MQQMAFAVRQTAAHTAIQIMARVFLLIGGHQRRVCVRWGGQMELTAMDLRVQQLSGHRGLGIVLVQMVGVMRVVGLIERGRQQITVYAVQQTEPSLARLQVAARCAQLAPPRQFQGQAHGRGRVVGLVQRRVLADVIPFRQPIPIAG